MKILLPLALVLVASFAVAQDATRRVTLDLPVDVFRAAVQRTGGAKDTPELTRAAVEAWAIRSLTNELSQELTALRLDAAAKVEDDDAALKTLTPEQCDAITKVLGQPLKRCIGAP